jgi:4-diphosphocytidyl-2-C-methyl-D-erythritol kinase
VIPFDGTIVPLAGGAVAVAAPAKVNLYLHVVGKRADGYHLLDSLVAFAGVADELVLRPSDTLSLSVEGPTASALEGEADNLVLRAARRLAEAAGIEAKADITLTKRLPVAAGIGGGSADCAAALRGLAALWKLDLSDERMRSIGLGLGADVPVCLRGRAATMTGIGEGLEDVPALPEAWMVLVNPRVATHTPAVFKARNGEFSAAAPLTETPRDAAELAIALHRRHNDLTGAACIVAPVVAEVLAALTDTDDHLLVRMSGSGATCFALYGSAGSAEAAAGALRAAHPAWWVAAAALVERRP